MTAAASGRRRSRRDGGEGGRGSGRGLWGADWGRALGGGVAFVGSQAGLVQLLGPLSARPPDFFSPGVAVAVTGVSLALLWACCWSLGRRGFSRLDRRLGEHRRAEQLYGPDAVPVAPALLTLAVVPVVLVAPLATTLSLSDRVASPMPVAPLVVGAVALLAAANLGRARQVAVVIPVWLLAAVTWFWWPRPVPEIAGAVVALGSASVLSRWMWRRRHRPRRVRLPSHGSRARRRRGGRGGVDGTRREVRVADVSVEFDERR